MREALLKLKETAEAEKMQHIKQLEEAEKTINQATAMRGELIGRANQAVGAIAALEAALKECDEAASKEGGP